MSTPLLSAKRDDGFDDRGPPPGTPRSGEISLYAQKIVCEAFVWLCSIVVFGSTSEFANSTDVCSSLCKSSIAWGVVSFVMTSAMLVAHLVQWKGKTEALTWYTSQSEKHAMFALAIWWTVGVSLLSAVEQPPGGLGGVSFHTSEIAIFFGWLAFFGSIYGSYKAHNAREEERLTLQYEENFATQAAEDEEYANFS
ncbi:hypothetical protein FGB62_12g128 [Gracilaria domingensis]|nr:hypothetical protein FGB62_12g128 [Gracilaria domingensis]